MDVQQSTTEQWEKLIENLNVLKNIEVTEQLEPKKLENLSENIVNKNFL